MENKFYVYEWYNIDTKEVFYVGKGCGKRYTETAHRNQTFLDYINSHNVESRIVIDNLTEEEAFKQEKIITDNYKKINQCFCNLAEAGYGGCHYVWTDEMREYWSEYNPMKREEQRKRMRENNPMKNKEVAQKNANARKREIFIGDKKFDGVIDAAKYYNRKDSAISNWLAQGRTPDGIHCGYTDGGTVKRKAGKAVIIDGEYYSSIAEASRAICISASTLRTALRENKHEYKGHTCEYANQQPS